jgi:hypothetical protein
MAIQGHTDGGSKVRNKSAALREAYAEGERIARSTEGDTAEGVYWWILGRPKNSTVRLMVVIDTITPTAVSLFRHDRYEVREYGDDAVLMVRYFDYTRAGRR